MGQLPAERSRALVGGVAMSLEDARLGITDAGVSRGDGAFETVGVWNGRPFRLDEHLQRLDCSLSALSLPAAPLGQLRTEADELVSGLTDDAALRMYLTASGTRILTLTPLPERPEPRVLIPQPAPWIQPVDSYTPAGAKSMSYGPNMAASRVAIGQGGDDALLVSIPDSYILEGPTFGLLFVARGVVHAPEVTLGIVDSISRRTLLEIATADQLDVLYGRWPLTALGDAGEVIISSSLRSAVAVQRVGEWTYPRAHPVADSLNRQLWIRRREVP
ncbi:MAG: aminotransferase class IV [Euzebya sp.]